MQESQTGLEVFYNVLSYMLGSITYAGQENELLTGAALTVKMISNDQ